MLPSTPSRSIVTWPTVNFDALMLSRAGPYSAEVVDMRHKLRRTFDRHNKEACNASFAMFGPNGTKIPDMLKRP